MVHYHILESGVKNNVPSQLHLKDPRRLNIGTFDARYLMFLAILAAIYDVSCVQKIDGRVLPISSLV